MPKPHAAKAKIATGSKPTKDAAEKRTYTSQEDIPAYTLENALRVGVAIAEHCGFKPTPPLLVAQAMEMAPTSSRFRMLAGASIAYGLTIGGYNAAAIELTELGLRILRPTEENHTAQAKREALLRPRVIREFLTKYENAPLPREDIGRNVLTTLGVPMEKAADVLASITLGAEWVGLIRVIKDKKYVYLETPPTKNDDARLDSGEDASGNSDNVHSPTLTTAVPPVHSPSPTISLENNKRVFITHGKNQSFVDPIKKLLGFGGFEPVVSVDKQSVSQPVSDKVMNDMRSCGAAIIHVDGEITIKDENGKEHVFLNPNVLIEIGAAMALYKRKFILLVRDGVKLLSNLQGLYEVRYKGESLDASETIKLMESINELKQLPKEA